MKVKKQKDNVNTEIYLVSFHICKKDKEELLIFKKTCSECPCQYDIYDDWEFNKPKYYGRLRWGYFYVAKKPLGKPIYEFRFRDKIQGAFYNPSIEIEHLKKACVNIWKQNEKRK